ncbi:hypothetical protein KOW79_003619 [Hemibagrus wyckioides]|uniref:Uncharacterized protein n=1 Tax=Hemibagrus wyckioides TaxID=337641 RepID=A0A9D3SVN7_9TELE|nr:hypothetical protein KOW79_003619 [Hemibagrus wyckioides]
MSVGGKRRGTRICLVLLVVVMVVILLMEILQLLFPAPPGTIQLFSMSKLQDHIMPDFYTESFGFDSSEGGGRDECTSKQHAKENSRGLGLC